MELAAKGIVLGGDLDAIDIGCAGSSAEDVVGDGSGPVVRIGVQGCLRLIVGVETFILRNQIGANIWIRTGDPGAGHPAIVVVVVGGGQVEISAAGRAGLTGVNHLCKDKRRRVVIDRGIGVALHRGDLGAAVRRNDGGRYGLWKAEERKDAQVVGLAGIVGGLDGLGVAITVVGGQLREVAVGDFAWQG